MARRHRVAVHHARPPAQPDARPASAHESHRHGAGTAVGHEDLRGGRGALVLDVHDGLGACRTATHAAPPAADSV